MDLSFLVDLDNAVVQALSVWDLLYVHSEKILTHISERSAIKRQLLPIVIVKT